MNGMLKYYDIISGTKGDKAMMWKAVKRVDGLLEKLSEAHPVMAHKFLIDEYVAMNGHHFNETLARQTVASMWHTDQNGERFDGEAVTPDEAQRLTEGMAEDKREKLRWDAYVGANAFVHDLASAGMGLEEIMKAAKAFWFHDEDMADGKHKVFWYFLNS